MPQAKILSHNGNGQYTIELQMDWSIVDRKINEYSDLVGALSPQVTTSQNAYNNLKLEYDSLIADEETALNNLVDVNHDPGSTDAEKKAATNAVIEAAKKVAEKRPGLQNAFDKWQVLLAKKTAAQKQKEFYESYPRTNTVTTAQAVDKVDGTVGVNVSGTYPTIPNGTFVDVYQLMREAKQPQWVIPPALQDNTETIPSLISPIVLPANINGKVVKHELLHDAAMFWNSAMLSGYQRWNPHIRRGKITAIGGSLFTVQLSPLLNSVDLAMQGEIDTFDFLVDYFCGPSAFRVNDFVIVKINSWPPGGSPSGTVIGFASGPVRECEYAPPGGGGHQYHWPKFTWPVAGAAPFEATGETVNTAFLLKVGTSSEEEGGPYEGPYDLSFTRISESVVDYFVYYKTMHNVHYVLRDSNYPTVPDFPGTGTIYYAEGGNDNFNITLPRRVLNWSLPLTMVWANASNEVEGYRTSGVSPIYGADSSWSVSKFRDPSGVGDPNVPQPSRRWGININTVRWNSSGPMSNSYQNASGYYYMDDIEAPSGYSIIETQTLWDQDDFTAEFTPEPIGSAGPFFNQYRLNVSGSGDDQFWVIDNELLEW